MMAGMFGINNSLFHKKYGLINLDNQSASVRTDDQTILERMVWPLIQHDHVCHDHWRHSKIKGKPTYQLGDHVHFNQAYGGVGLEYYITEHVYKIHANIYPKGQDTRPFPSHKPLDYGLYVGQIIEPDGRPRMNMDVRWEYELRGEKYD